MQKLAEIDPIFAQFKPTAGNIAWVRLYLFSIKTRGLNQEQRAQIWLRPCEPCPICGPRPSGELMPQTGGFFDVSGPKQALMDVFDRFPTNSGGFRLVFGSFFFALRYLVLRRWSIAPCHIRWDTFAGLLLLLGIGFPYQWWFRGHCCWSVFFRKPLSVPWLEYN